MDDSFREVYEDAMLYEGLKECVRRFQITDLSALIPYWNNLAVKIGDFCERISSSDINLANRIMNTAYKVTENFENDAYAQGVIEGELMPVFLEYLDRYRSIEVDDGEWRICGTPSGFVTLEDMSSGVYLHSTFDPMWDAYTLADFMYEDGMKDFWFFGSGLGYLPYQMWMVSEGSIRVHVYECDPRIPEYARMFGPLGFIAPDRLDIHVEDSLESLADRYMELAKGPDEFHVHPSGWMTAMLSGLERRDLTARLTTYHSHIVAQRRYNINVSFNKSLFGSSVKTHMDLPKYLMRDEWLVLAAGPSLNDNIDFVRESIGKRTVIGVSTVIPRLAKEGIKPDLLIVCDPFNTIMPHLRGYEDYTSDIPLVAHVQTHWQFTESYKGPIYRIAEAGDPYDVNHRYPRWNSGGTVTSLAIELACLSGAKRVYIAGMDLAYPGGKYYADGTSNERTSGADSELMVRANDGTQVMTARNFRFYAEQVGQQVMARRNVEFWNLAAQGQYIPLTRTGKWWENGIDKNTDIDRWMDELQKDTFLNWRERYYILRQTVDRSDIDLTESAAEKAKAVLETICTGMLSEYRQLADIRIRSGNGLTVLITDTRPEKHELDRAAGKGAILLINTGERNILEPVFIRHQTSPVTDVSVNDSVSINGRDCPYIRMTGDLGDINVYEEFLQTLAGQESVNIINADPYSLFGMLCERLSYQ